MIDTRFSRRYFFFGSLLAGAVPSRGFGSTSSVAPVKYKSVTDKLNVAVVGLGLRGSQIVIGAAASENIVALCEVDDERMARGAQTYTKAAKYRDFRQMLDKEGKNIDAVMIAVPDHHAHADRTALHAARQACLLRKAADPHRFRSAIAERRRGQI